MVRSRLVLLLWALTAACGGPSGDRLADGTAAMASRLDAAAEALDARFDVITPGRRLAFLRAEPPPADPRARVEHELLVAVAALMDGDTEAAVADLERVLAEVEADWTRYDPKTADFIRRMRAIAFLRLGEQRNCCARHNPQSCLLPLEGGGQHSDLAGAEGAFDAYLELLERDPDDVESRWLLNIAAMALDRWPDGVLERFRVPPERLASAYPLPRFWDVATAAGVAVDALSGGVVMEDLDGDLDLDLFVTSWGFQDDPRVFRNDGGGRFTDVTGAAGLAGIAGGLNVVHGDYDNDGLTDLYVLRGGWLGVNGRLPDSLLRNLGGLRFADVTEAAGLLDPQPTQTAAWADFDLDGWLDLAVGVESGGGVEAPCRIWRNRGDGTFVDVAAEVGANVRGFVKAVLWGDVDDDGDPDLFLSRLGEPNVLLRNDDGGRRFADVSDEAGVAAPSNAFGAVFFDADGDGRLDLLVFAYDAESRYSAKPDQVARDVLGLPTTVERPRLFRNDGDGRFTDVAREMGLDVVLYPMGLNVGDLDNDGFEDVYAATGGPDYRSLMPNRMFRNDRGRRFQDVTTAGGFGHLQKGHGVAFGDLDDDGDQDVYHVLGGAWSGDLYPNALFANPGPAAAWVSLVLEGRTSNRSAIGARLELELDGPEGPRRLVRHVSTGGSFGSQSLRQEIGLGTAERLVQLTVRWPSGREQRFTDLPVRRLLHLVEGGRPEPRSLPAGDLAALADGLLRSRPGGP